MNTVPTFPISKAEFYRFVVANEGQGRFEFVRGHIVQQMRGARVDMAVWPWRFIAHSGHS